MTIRQIDLNTPGHKHYPTTQVNQHPRHCFSQVLKRAQESSTEDICEARKVLRLLQDCMLGLLSGRAEEMEILSSYNCVRPFTPSSCAGYNTYRTAALTSATGAKHPPSPNEVAQHAGTPARVVKKASEPVSSQPVSLRDEVEQLIDQVAQLVGLPAPLVRSVVSTESSFQPDAVSPAGAQGLMQLMPETAKELGIDNSFDPQQNLLGGCRYLKGLLQKYDGDIDHALAAYNWGQGNVDRKGLEQMPTETRNYIAKVKQSAGQFS